MSEKKHRKELIRDAEKVLGPPVRPTASARIPREDVNTLRKLGYSIQRIADYYEVSHMTIWRIIGPQSYSERVELMKARAANIKASRIKAKQI
jgi:DNA invertase Pin-like site-specific DNA recombinase